MDNNMMSVIYKKKNFIVYDAKNKYIVYNNELDFNNHHANLRSFKTAKFIIEIASNKSIPKNLSIYLINSLIKITNDENYLNRLRYRLTKEIDNNHKDKKLEYKNKRGDRRYYEY